MNTSLECCDSFCIPCADKIAILGWYATATWAMRPAEQPAAPIPDTVDEHNRVGSTNNEAAFT
jgi:hypothetical protein